MRRFFGAAVASFALGFVLLLAACGGGSDADLAVTITSPAEGEVLREEPFLVTGTISEEPPKSGAWLVVGNVVDGQYYPVRSIDIEGDQATRAALPWSAQFYNGVCQDTFVPGDREVLVVRADAAILAGIADSLALRQPMARPDLEGHVLASVVVDIEKPDTAFCLGAAPNPTASPVPNEGGP